MGQAKQRKNSPNKAAPNPNETDEQFANRFKATIADLAFLMTEASLRKLTVGYSIKHGKKKGTFEVESATVTREV